MNDLIQTDSAVAGVDDLMPVARAINHEHDQVRQCVAQGLAHAKRAGELLHQAKASLPHGQWLPWLAAHCEVSERTAQAYMQIAAQWPVLEAKAQRVADLPFRQAMALLAESSDEPAADHPSELSDLESAIAKVNDDVDEMLWEQARQVVAVLDAGLAERLLACFWINERTGEPYGLRHVRIVRRMVRRYLDSHPRPRFRDLYNTFTER